MEFINDHIRPTRGRWIHIQPRRQPPPGLAGLAYIGVVCGNLAYGCSVDSSGTVSHEMGHNWNSSHCHDTAPCNLMCDGGCPWIGPNTKDIMMAFRDTRACLDDAPAYSEVTAPYAHPDRVALERDEVAARTPVLVDVLANDHDANCELLALDL